MDSKERRGDDRRNWLTRFMHVHNILKHIEEVGRNNVDLESLAESLDLPHAVIYRIFSEIRNDYSHRFPWLKEDEELDEVKIPERNKK